MMQTTSRRQTEMRKIMTTSETSSMSLKKGKKLEMMNLETLMKGLEQKEWMVEHLVNLLYQSHHEHQ
jgi:hypothetical protein